MVQINIKSILDGITLTLRKNFPDCQIHTEKVEQGLAEPAFIVCAVMTKRSPINMNLTRQIPRFNITYIPLEGLNECYQVQETLLNILEIIPLSQGGSIIGHDISCQISDEMLNLSISYNHNLFGKAEEIYMETEKIIQEA